MYQCDLGCIEIMLTKCGLGTKLSSRTHSPLKRQYRLNVTLHTGNSVNLIDTLHLKRQPIADLTDSSSLTNLSADLRSGDIVYSEVKLFMAKA